jgi:hypothetical protein
MVRTVIYIGETYLSNSFRAAARFSTTLVDSSCHKDVPSADITTQRRDFNFGGRLENLVVICPHIAVY